MLLLELKRAQNQDSHSAMIAVALPFVTFTTST